MIDNASITKTSIKTFFELIKNIICELMETHQGHNLRTFSGELKTPGTSKYEEPITHNLYFVIHDRISG